MEKCNRFLEQIRGCSSKWRWKSTTHLNEMLRLETSKRQYWSSKKSKWAKRCALKNWTTWRLLVSLLIFNYTQKVKRSVLAFGSTAWISKIKSFARLLERLGPPNNAPCCEESQSYLRKNAASKLENWDFLHWSCSHQISLISKSGLANLTNPCWQRFVRFQNPDRYGIDFPSISWKKSGCGF
jgi:hypothetical protein